MLLSIGSLALTLTAFLSLAVSLEATNHVQHSKKVETGASLEWPALRFHFSTKRKSANVYGQSSIDMFANPIVLDNNKKVLYDVYATFTQGQLLHNYTLANGVAYYKSTPLSTGSSLTAPTPSVMCSDAEFLKIPAINSIVAAVNEATTESRSDGDANITDANSQCTSESVYKTAINGVDYAVCVTGTTGFQMQSSVMDISVEYLESHIEIEPPNVNHKCPSKALSTSVTALGHSLLTGEPLPAKDKRRLRSAFSFKNFWKSLTQCSCKSKPRPCVFLHGQGIQYEMAENQDSFPQYWGNLVNRGPCCTSIKYARLNTVSYAWTSEELQQKTCSRALAVNEHSTNSTIVETIVVTHSMGNLMLAGAIANGLCKLDSSSTWVGISGPMKGSMASDFLQDTCAQKSGAILKKIGNITGKCPVKKSILSVAYEGGRHSSTALNAAYEAAQKVYRKNVYALMCGESSAGLFSKHQFKFLLFGRIIPHHSDKTDGMVEFQSCAAGFPDDKFGHSFLDRFYRAKLNHFDTEFLAGDSLFNTAKMPVKWFECLM